MTTSASSSGIDMSAPGLAGLTVGDYCVIVQIYKPRE
jgi:hypothetical protein